MDYISDRVFEGSLTSVLEENFAEMKVSPNIKALLAFINHKDAFAILPTRHGKSIKIQLISDVGRFLFLSGYSYPHLVIVLVVCPLKSLVSNFLQIAKTCHFQWPVWAVKTLTSTICSKNLMPVHSEIPRSSYKTRSGDTCSVVMAFVNVADENVLANRHIDPGQVDQKRHVPLFTTWVET